jgi:cytosine deaminase
VADAAETMAEAGVALVTHGAGGLTMPPIEMLLAAGVLVFVGNDDIRDTWSPYGTGDLLERAAMIYLRLDQSRRNARSARSFSRGCARLSPGIRQSSHAGTALDPRHSRPSPPSCR